MSIDPAVLRRERLYDLKALPERLDLMQEGTREYLLQSSACFVRGRVMTADQLCDPRRFVPGVFVAGPSYSKKTQTVHLAERILSHSHGRGREEKLVKTFREHLRLERLVSNTTRKRRCLARSYFKEVYGDPYYFFEDESLARFLQNQILEDQEIVRKARSDAAPLRRFAHWSYFVDDLYAMPYRKVLLVARQPNIAVLQDGALDQMQVMWTLMPNTDLVYVRSGWFDRLHSRNSELDSLLAEYRPDQSEEEQYIRRLVGVLMTGYVSDHGINRDPDELDNERLPASHVISVRKGTERGFARDILRLLLLQRTKERQMMVEDVRRFLERNHDRIAKMAFSKELQSIAPLVQLPGFLSPLLPDGCYYFGSALTGDEPVPPMPERYRD